MNKSLKIVTCILLSLAMLLAVAFGTQTAVKAETASSGEDFAPITGEEFDRAYNPEEVKNNYRRVRIEKEEGWISRQPAMASPANTSNSISGITIKLDTKNTGMGSWTPDSAYNQIERSADWISFFTTEMKDLKAGDVIVWEDDLLGGALFNHIAIIVEVAPDFTWYRCADGNCPVSSERPTGIDFVLRTTLQKAGSSSGHVCIWRNTAHGDDIAKSAELYTENVIKNNDMSFNNEYNSIGWGWCYCYVVEMLLATQDADGRLATQIASERFSDVIDRTSAIYKPIQWAADNGIVSGFDNGTFRPDENCTRAQFVIMLWRMMGKPEADAVEEELSFSDVSEKDNFYKAVRWASNAGIIKGYADGSFKPNDALTRGNIVTMIWRLEEKPEGESYIVFSDTDATDPCFRAIRWAAAVGLVKGFADGTFGSTNNCTRAQLAIILYRAVDNGLIELIVEEPVIVTPDVPEDQEANENPVNVPETTEIPEIEGNEIVGDTPSSDGNVEDGNVEEGYYDEYGYYHYGEGYYDSYGNYYVNGGYYDVYGNFHIGDGYYDIYGNYYSDYDTDSSGEDYNNSSEEGYYDEFGNLHIGDGYYDLFGNYHIGDGYYDSDGNYHSYESLDGYNG